MRLNKLSTAWLALAMAALLAGTAVADDRDFLRKLAAPPNLIFILDTSKSMVGSPEEPGYQMNSIVKYGMVPGAGDDPYSRMGIAKRVLREFLGDVTDANYVLAGYAQAPPAAPGWPIQTKHWVYEGIGFWDDTLATPAYRTDHFHLMEQNYTYRFGYAETFTGLSLDNPSEIYQGSMIGFKPYFDPSLGAVDVQNRYGPVRAFDADPLLPYDLMPVYFGSCIYDAVEDETLCGDGLFPFYDTGARDGMNKMITDSWYYGNLSTNRFDNCVPWKTVVDPILSPDDGCFVSWEDNTGTVPGHVGKRVDYRRRVRLEIPTVNPVDGADNHVLSISDPDGVPMSGDEVPVGNRLEADIMLEDYDLDGTWDDDYDGDAANDWVLYVNSVEQISLRECATLRTPTYTPTPSDTPTPTDTPTDTPTVTNTPTDTPVATNTPTPAPPICDAVGGLYISDDLDRSTSAMNRINLEVDNETDYRAYLIETQILWDDTESQSSAPYINYLRFDGMCQDQYWHDNITSHPFTGIGPPYADPSPPGHNSDCLDSEMYIPPLSESSNYDDNDWDAYLNTGTSWIGTTCVSLTFNFPDYDGGAFECVLTDCATYTLQTPTRTPTATPRPPTNTPDPSWTNTPTRTNTPPSVATNTPPPAATNTPPPAATNTPVPATPPPTNTPAPTNTPTPNVIE
jgi:hypothetical protein